MFGHQRRVSTLLRLLFTAEPPLTQSAADTSCFISLDGLHFPAPAPLAKDVAWYNAAATHMACHLKHSKQVFDVDRFPAVTRALIGLLEDVRVERLAIRKLPGLRRLWGGFHRNALAAGSTFEGLMQRLSLALLDPATVDPHPWVAKGRALFETDFQPLEAVPAEVHIYLASVLGNDIGQLRLTFNAQDYRPTPSYRDDNRWLWFRKGQEPEASSVQEVAKTRLDEADGVSHGDPEFTRRYPEWDQRIRRYRPDWTTVREVPIEDGGPAVDAPPASPALVRVLRTSASRTATQRRLYEEGDTVDLKGLVALVCDQAVRGFSDARIFRRMTRYPGLASALLLLDISASTAITHTHFRETQLHLQQRLALKLCRSMCKAGWSVALGAFQSAGRSAVSFMRIKSFEDPLGTVLPSRLGALRPALSTRLGAALRHANDSFFSGQPGRKLILVFSDAEVHDIDVHEPNYLLADAKSAVREAREDGVLCVCLVPQAEQIGGAQQIFGSYRVASAYPEEALERSVKRILAVWRP